MNFWASRILGLAAAAAIYGSLAATALPAASTASTASMPPAAAAAPALPAAPERATHWSGDVVNVTSRARATFTLSVNHFADNGEMTQLAAALGRIAKIDDAVVDDVDSSGAYPLRDAQWKASAGSLVIGHSLDDQMTYPLAAAAIQETPKGRQLLAVLNRPPLAISPFLSFSTLTRSSRFVILQIQLPAQGSGAGEGSLLTIDKMKVDGNVISFDNPSPQSARFFNVHPG